MRVWRLAKSRYPLLDGEGARLYGGRWNSPGHAVVYTAGHLSLAVLELLVHTDPDLLPDNLVAFSITIPDDVNIEQAENLPDDWNGYPAPRYCAEVGDNWVRSLRTAVLAIPSAIVPEESNYLLNPAHPDMNRISISSRREFRFDERLFRT